MNAAPPSSTNPNPAQKQGRRRIGKRNVRSQVGWWSAFLLGTPLIIVALLLTWFRTHQKELLEATLARVDEQLAVPLKVQGAEIDLWSDFPHLSLTLNNVWCREVLPKNSSDTLFHFSRAYVQFNVWDLIQGKTVVERLHFKNGRVELRSYTDGSDNFHFWKSSEGPNPNVDLSRIRWANIRLRVESEGYFAQECVIREGVLRGRLHPTGFQAQANWDVEIARSAGSIQRPLLVQGNVEIEQDASTLALRAGKLNLGAWEMQWSGTARPNDLKWNARAQNLDVGELAALLPPEWLPDPQTVRADGTLDLDLRGRTVPQGSRIRARAALHNGRIELPTQGWTLNQVQARLDWDNGPQGRMDQAELNATFTADATDGTVRIRNFEAPELTVQLEAHLPLQTALAWGGFRIIQESSGTVTGTFDIQKNYPNWTSVSETGLDSARVKGSLSLQKGRAAVYGTGLPMEDLSAELTLASPHAELTACRFRVGSSQIRLSGTLENVLDWGGSAPLYFNLRATAGTVNAQNLMAWAPWSASEPPLPPGQTPESETPWDFRLDLFAERLEYRSFRGLRARGVLASEGSRLLGTDLYVNTAEGVLSGTFSWEPDGNGSVLKADAKAKGISLPAIMREWENFGQTSLTANQLEGKLDARVVCSVPFNAQNEPQSAQARAVVDFTLTHGKVSNYAPLLALSKYANAQALNKLTFGTLTNTLTWSNGVLTVPPMQIDNNALALKLYGTHRLDNTVDYTVQFRLKEALQARNTPRPKKWDAYLEEATDPGKVWIPVRITGNAQNPKITLDRNAASRNSAQTLQSDFQKQGKELRQLLKPDAPAATPKEKYIFEWEETVDTNKK
jgi:hypothetical protein